MTATPTIGRPTPIDHASGLPLLADDHGPCDTHGTTVVGEPSSSTGQTTVDTHSARAGAALPPSQPPTKGLTSPRAPSSDGWLELRIWAEMFHDAQQSRIAATNRAERGGVDPALYAAYIDRLNDAERVCRLGLVRCYRRVVPAPIIEWQKNTPGLGEPSMSRLLGHLGHPAIATPHHWEGTGVNRTLVAGEPFERTVSQLWQFCGHGRPERKRKGMSADDLAAMGNPMLKMIVHLIAEGIVKARVRYPSGLGDVYDKTRFAVEDKTHTVECVRCGPSGKPAQPGSPWSPGHQHAHAMRIVGKEMLRDLWRTARLETTA